MEGLLLEANPGIKLQHICRSLPRMTRQLRSVLCLSALGLVLFTAGCNKKPVATAAPDTNSAAAMPPNTAPGPAPTPAAVETIPASDNMADILAQLTRELHRTMIGRKLSGSFEEFVAIRQLSVPPPPAGKKYAISKQWRVVLVDK